MEPFDPTKPNIARVWDYWLGGKDNISQVVPATPAQRPYCDHTGTLCWFFENCISRCTLLCLVHIWGLCPILSGGVS